MICINCNNNKFKTITENIKLTQGNIIRIVPNVPALKCLTCGETYRSHEVSLMIDETIFPEEGEE